MRLLAFLISVFEHPLQAVTARHLYKTLIALAIGFQLFSFSAFSQTPSLKEAKTRFDQADAALNKTWESLKKTLPAEEFNLLKEEQRAWIEYRDELALSPSYSGAPADRTQARQSSEYFVTAADLTEERRSWLAALGKALPFEEGALTGLWNDGYGGRMELVQKGSKLYFSISVVRGPTAHTGDLAGIAFWNQPLGWYSDKGIDPEKEDETNLAFNRNGNKLEVMGANTLFYHGARAYFDGTYVRTGSLTPEAQKKLLQETK